MKKVKAFVTLKDNKIDKISLRKEDLVENKCGFDTGQEVRIINVTITQDERESKRQIRKTKK